MDLSIDKFVNVPLLTHPMNWIIVWTVLIFWGLAAHILMGGVNSPASTDRKQA